MNRPSSVFNAFLFLSTFLFSIAPALFAQQIRLNEASTSNTLFLDEDGDSPDWFELYNDGTTDQSLQDWTITDDFEEPEKWTFSDISLSANAYLKIWASAKDRSIIGVARTLIKEGDIFRYRVPNGALPNDWTTLAYNDASWAQGASGFGYADNDDATLLGTGTASVFLRKQFTISNIEEVEKILLDMDYDDAFVAYINGVEVARANINGFPPAYNATAITDREATLYQGAGLERYELNDLEGILQNGTNVLSIQVHNISTFSSDMSVIPFLTVLFNVPTSVGMTPPAILALNETCLHTNFKLSSAGETLYLFNPSGILVDSMVLENLPTDVSFGRSSSNPDSKLYFENPSPGFPNGGNTFAGINTPHIQFSHPGGKVSPLTLSLSGTVAQEQIRYTLDATEPDQNSLLYTGGIYIEENTVVRARIYRSNYRPSSIQSHTYLVNVDHDLPIISLVTEPDNLFDQQDGIYAFGDDYEENFPYFGANFWEDWERPIHFTFFEPDGTLGLSFNGGTKIFGGWSRGQEQRSFSIFARSQYGINEIDYPLFPQLDYQKFQALVMRNSGNDWLRSMLRDATLTGLLKGADIERQAYRPTVTYLNGEYWGIYNLREKVNEHFLASKYSVDPDEVDILEFAGAAIHGNNLAYNSLISFVNNNNLLAQSNFDVVASQVDIENFILYNVAQIYFDNTDWPGNNIKFWKSPSTKWRWIIFDTDFGFGTWNPNSFQNNTLYFALEANGPGWPNPPWSTLLLRRLVQNESFRHRFVNRFADELNSRFLPNRVIAHIDATAAGISSEIPDHYARWGSNEFEWNQHINTMRNFGNLRPAYLKAFIRNQFSLPAYHPLRIEMEDPNQGYVQINNRLQIQEEEWMGDYFESVPIKVRAIAEAGYIFLHWSGASTSTEPELEINMQTALTLQPIFVESTADLLPIVINEINYKSSPDLDAGDWIELYNPSETAVDLSAWELKDDDDTNSFIFPENTTLAANDYLIICRDQNKFASVYPVISEVVTDLGFGLSSNGDAVRLFNREGILEDMVVYLPVSPWPEAANGQGPTLELIDPSLDNSLPESWANVNLMGSPDAPNIVTATQNLNPAVIQLLHYPNPFSDQVELQFQLPTSSKVRLSLFHANGAKAIDIFSGELSAGPQELQADCSHLSNGVYFFKFEMLGEGIITTRWVKI